MSDNMFEVGSFECAIAMRDDPAFAASVLAILADFVDVKQISANMVHLPNPERVRDFYSELSQDAGEYCDDQKNQRMETQTPQYLTFDQLRAKLGNRGRTSIYRDVDHGRLPKPVKIGARSYWVEDTVDAHIRNMSAK